MSDRAACPCACQDAVGSEGPAADTAAIIVAGGSGVRFGDARGKQYVELCGLPVACWSILAFDHAPSVASIVVVVAPDRVSTMRETVLGRLQLSKPVTIALGGAERQESVRRGLAAADGELPFVAVHDAARPLIEVAAIEECIACVREDPAVAGAICATPVTDTLKLVEGGTIVSTPDRSFYWAAQTPQVFRSQALRHAHDEAHRVAYLGTDDASLVERQGGRVRCVACSRSNIKVTMPEDLAIAETTLRERLVAEGCGL